MSDGYGEHLLGIRLSTLPVTERGAWPVDEHARVIYLTAWPATPMATQAVNVLPAPLALRVVVRDLPEGATW